MRTAPLVPGLAATLALTLLPGCDSEATVTFHVVGTLVSDSCGDEAPGLPGAAPWQTQWNFTVGVDEQPTTLTWTPSDGTPTLHGYVDDGSVSLAAAVPLGGDPADGGQASCATEMQESISLTIYADTDGGPPTSFVGRSTYQFFGAGADGGCAASTTGDSGTVASLPCAVVYSLSGSM
jgi:hypothetical protein